MIDIKIYLIRHGETNWNVAGRLQGRENIPLNEAGIEQAHACGRALAGTRAAGILSSPLDRAVDTAKIIAGHMGFGGEVEVDEELTERDFGELSGKTPEDLFRPDEGARGIEPLEAVMKRFRAAIIKDALKYADDIIIVSHGGSINAILRDVSGGSVGSGKTVLKNGGISILSYEDGALLLEDHDLSADVYIKKYKVKAGPDRN